jgi:hypothetical protein
MKEFTGSSFSSCFVSSDFSFPSFVILNLPVSPKPRQGVGGIQDLNHILISKPLGKRKEGAA